MARFGMTLSSEEHDPRALVEQARAAEAAGFDFVSISDHFHPWVTEQGHSPFVWSVLGALAEATDSIEVAVGVTCPTVRIHPAIVAHAAATSALLLEGRFVLGLGTGEALNEHILGHRWPPPETRRAMLAEAVEVMRSLWTATSTGWRTPVCSMCRTQGSPWSSRASGRSRSSWRHEWATGSGATPRMPT